MPSEKSMQAARKISLSACPKCQGRGVVTVLRGTIFDTDSAEERRLAFQKERCPECDKVIASAIDQAVSEEREAQRAENAALRADKDRLDWLDSGGVWRMEKRFDTTRGAHWPVFFKPTFGWESYGHDTARAAIDAARSK